VTLASADEALAAFSGELYSATLTRPPTSAYDANDATAGPTGTPTTFACEGQAFSYMQRDIDGTRVVKGDYRVVILRGSLSTLPVPGDSISIPPPGESVARSARVINIEVVTEWQLTIQVRG
jgi:hypothetical protein